MLCPKCRNKLRESKKSNDYFLCDYCRKKIWADEAILEAGSKNRKHTSLIVIGIFLVIIIALLFLCIYLYTKTAKETRVNKQEDVHEETSTENTEDVSELESLSELEVEKEVFNVKIVLPADLVGDSTQEDLEAEAKKYGHKVTLNADGTATYIMTKRQHSKMMKDLKDEIEKNMSDMVGSDEFPNIVDVSSNSSFTEFKITTRNTKPDIAESFSVIGLYMQSGIYHTFNGTTVENIHVDFINADTKEIISSSDSSNLNE